MHFSLHFDPHQIASLVAYSLFPSRLVVDRGKMSKQIEYYSEDFDWERLRQDVESDPLLQYHLLPFENETDTSSSSLSSQQESEAWNEFHNRHSTGKFFKERRYLLIEFPELASCGDHSKVLEVGCGNGSTALPILRGNGSIIVYACDCSPEAFERAKENINAANVISTKHRFYPFQCDFSMSGFPKWLFCISCKEFFSKNQHCSTDVNDNERDLNGFTCPKDSNCCIGGVDVITLIFTLSAVPLNRMPTAISECFSVLRPCGLLLFRDYGLYDMTMLRFTQDQKVGFREYMRSDGTRSYFFSLDILRNLFAAAGFLEIELEYCCVISKNRRKGKSMRRVWVHGKFQKPM